MSCLCPNCESDNMRTHSANPPRWVCGDCGKTTRHPIDGYVFPKQEVKSNIVVFTWAQNATPVFKPFLRSLHTYCRDRGAQLIVIPGRYRNPTSSWTAQQESHDWWSPEVAGYLCADDIAVNSNLRLMGNVKIQPTASEPLTGLKTMCGANSVIFGHPQVAFETVATPQSKMAKIVCTTGAVTKPNYTDSKAGVKGEFHHQYGATVVELDGGKFHMRQLIADGSGKFYDLDRCYNGDKVTDGHRAEAFVSGDLHAKFTDKDVIDCWWLGEESLLSQIKPKLQVFHDVFDGYFGSHHHLNDPFLQYKKAVNGDNCGRSEVDLTAELLDSLCICPKNYVTKSNHDEHFNRWLKSTDWRKDMTNARLYLECALGWVKAIDEGRSFDPIADVLSKKAKKAIFLRRNDKLMAKGYALNYHGDSGPNGARGSAKAFDQIGVRSIIGHSHSPRIHKGCTQVGLSARYDLEYAVGSPSSWMHTAAIVYPNGRSTLITCIDGEYTID